MSDISNFLYVQIYQQSEQCLFHLPLNFSLKLTIGIFGGRVDGRMILITDSPLLSSPVLSSPVMSSISLISLERDVMWCDVMWCEPLNDRRAADIHRFQVKEDSQLIISFFCFVILLIVLTVLHWPLRDLSRIRDYARTFIFACLMRSSALGTLSTQSIVDNKVYCSIGMCCSLYLTA